MALVSCLEPEGGNYTYSEGTSAPWGSTPDLAQISQQRERGLISQGDVDNAVMGHGAHGGDGSALLSATQGAGGDEEASVLAPVLAPLPLPACLVPEGLPLGGEVTVTGGDAEEEGVVCLEVVGLNGRVVGFGGGVHFGENLLGEGLCDSGGGRVSRGIVIVSDWMRRGWRAKQDGTNGLQKAGRLTGRYRRNHRRPQCPSSRPQRVSGCGRTSSTTRGRSASIRRHWSARL
jgi:hypothetical protein